MNKVLEFCKKNYFLIILLVVAILLRLLFVTSSGNYIDENVRLEWGTSAELLRQMGLEKDWAPPTIYWFTAFLQSVTSSIVFIRLVFMLFGLANIVLVYYIARQFSSEKAAALIASVNLFAVISSIHISPYTLLGTITLLTVLVVMKFLRRFLWASLVVLGLLWGLGISIHYFYIFVIIPEFIWLVVYFVRKKESFFKAVVPGLISLVLFAPHILLFLHQLGRSSGNNYFVLSIPVLLIGMSLFYLSHWFSVQFLLQNPLALAMAGVLFISTSALLITFVLNYKKFSRTEWFIAATFFGFWLFNALTSIGGLGKFSSRYLSLVMPLYFLMLAFGAKYIQSRVLRYTLLTIIIAGSLICIGIAYPHIPFVQNELNI